MGSFFCIALSLPFLFGLGLLAGTAIGQARTGTPAEQLGLAGLLGLLVNLALLFLVPGISPALYGAALAAALGWALWLRRLPWPGAGAVFFLAVFLVISVKIISEPLESWDPRSIWFFHSKMIFHGGSVWAREAWQNPEYYFSKPAYPLLVPGLGAQAAHVAGFWNEYLPKLSLVLVLAPAMLLLFTSAGTFPGRVLLLVLLVIRVVDWIWIGAMDGFLSLYAALAALKIGAWLERGEERELLLGFACLAVALNLKNEGFLLFFAFGLALASVLWGARQRRPALPRVSAKLLGFLFLCVAGIAATVARKLAWGLENDLQMGLDSPARFWGRAVSGEAWGMIVFSLLHEGGTWKVLVLQLLAALLARARKLSVPVSARFCFLCAAFYSCGLAYVYFATPNDLTWQLSRSAFRTMLSANSLLLVGLYFWVSGWKSAPQRFSQ